LLPIEGKLLDTVLASAYGQFPPYLARRVPDLLGSNGVAVSSHRRVPPNGGSMALGQAMIEGS